jgi:hypothetical protein
MTEDLRASEYRINRVESDHKNDSLIGSFFLATSERGWQGCVVAEPAPGVYLVELFSWIMGDSLDQRLVALATMIEEGWRFYDTSQWMNTAYNDSVRLVWERERAEREKATPAKPS